MVDVILTWLFGLNPLLVWFGGGLVCGSIYLVAIPDSDNPSENRDRAFVAVGLVIIWPSVLIWLGPVFLAVWVAGLWRQWRGGAVGESGR